MAGLVTLLTFLCTLGAAYFHITDQTFYKKHNRIVDNSEWIYTLWFGAAAFEAMLAVLLGSGMFLIVALGFYCVACYWKSRFFQRNPALDRRVGSAV